MGPLRVSRSVLVPERELRWRFSRSSGPGGQSVNTDRLPRRAQPRRRDQHGVRSESSASRALERLSGRLVDGVLTVVAQEERSQLRNREAAMARMAELLAAAIAPPPRRTEGHHALGDARRSGGSTSKERRSRTKRLRRPPDDDA